VSVLLEERPLIFTQIRAVSPKKFSHSKNCWIKKWAREAMEKNRAGSFYKPGCLFEFWTKHSCVLSCPPKKNYVQPKGEKIFKPQTNPTLPSPLKNDGLSLIYCSSNQYYVSLLWWYDLCYVNAIPLFLAFTIWEGNKSDFETVTPNCSQIHSRLSPKIWWHLLNLNSICIKIFLTSHQGYWVRLMKPVSLTTYRAIFDHVVLTWNHLFTTGPAFFFTM